MSYLGMTALNLKWALRGPATRGYPLALRRVIPESRGALVFSKDTCIYCGICRRKCPTAAILVDRPQKRWTIDRLRCINCGACVEACPKDCLQLSTDITPPAVTKAREVH